MAIRVGINGFGRIGRNVFRACSRRDGPRVRRRQRPHRREDARAPPQVRLGPRHARRTTCRPRATRSSSDGKSIQVLAERDPGEAALEGPRRRPRPRVHRPLHRARQGGRSTSRRARRRCSSPRRPRAPTSRSASASTTTPTIPRSTTSSRTRRARRTAWRRSRRCCTRRFGIKRGLMTTIHAYTNDQRILDLPHEDLRRARAAALSMIPTTHRRREGVGLVHPGAQGQARRHGGPRADAERLAGRPHVPSSRSRRPRRRSTPRSRRPPRAPLKGVLQYSDEPLVSIDFNGTAVLVDLRRALTRRDRRQRS